MAFCDKKTQVRVFFFSPQNTSIWTSLSAFPSQIQREKSVYKIMKNSQVRAEKLGKTAEFVISLIFSTLMPLDRMFSNIFTKRLLRWIRLLIPISTYFEKIKYHLYNRLFWPQIAICDGQFRFYRKMLFVNAAYE